MTLLQHLRTKIAQRKLASLVKQTKAMNADYAKRRAAAKLGHARKRGVA